MAGNPTGGPAGWAVPGYDLVEMVGFGATGEVWLARDATSGEHVALKRLRTPGDLVGRDRLRREAAVLAGVTHPHVVRLRTVVSAGEDLVLVLDHAAGGSLAGLLSTRCLSPGEVVTLAVPLAEALATVHRAGLAHGDVSPGNVLFSADGRPLLADLGVCRLVGDPDGGAVAGTAGFVDPVVLAGAEPSPASDVYGLAAVCAAALTGRAPDPAEPDPAAWLSAAAPGAPAALVGALAAALDLPPHPRPSAAELAQAVFAAWPAAPVLLGRRSAEEVPGLVAGPHGAVTHEVRGSRVPVVDDAAPGAPAPRARLWRLAAAGLAVVGVLGVAVLTGVVWAGTDGRQSAAEPSAAASRGTVQARPTVVSWTEVLAGLDRVRSAAFATADPAVLDQVYAPGSPALARDRLRVAQLRDAGFTAHGVRLDTRSVRVVSSSPDTAVLRVVDVMPPYRLVGRQGRTTASRPGRPAEQWSVTLVRAGASWRVHDVRRA